MADQRERSSKRWDYSGEKARQGRIILNTPAKRIIFISGLIGVVALAILGRLWFGG